MTGKLPDSDDLSEVHERLKERDLTIAALNQRVLALERELSELTQKLRARGAELEQLKSPPASPRHSEPAARETSPPSLYPDMTAAPVLRRVSVALRDNVSVPPPSRASRPDTVPPSRRREPRRSCELELEFKDETHFYAGLTQDLSQGGVFIATYQVFPVGSQLELGFQLPGGSEVRARGVVRWVRAEAEPGAERPGMGVAFTELSESALAEIANYCREREPLYMEI